jgi:hypothetical protein
VTEERYYKVERRVWDAGQSVWTPWQVFYYAGLYYPNQTWYVDQSVSQGYSYQYGVSACNGAGCSQPRFVTAVIGEMPLPPGNVSAASTSVYDVRVTWADHSSDETFFLIERRVGHGDYWTDWHRAGVASANATDYIDSSVSSGFTYQYRVRSCKIAVCSDPASSSPAVGLRVARRIDSSQLLRATSRSPTERLYFRIDAVAL